MSPTSTPTTLPNPSKGVAHQTTLTVWMRRHPVISYFVLAFGLSWAVWIPMALVGARVYEGQVWPTDIPGIFGPLVAAFIMSALVAGGSGVRGLLQRMARWRVSAKWYLVALSPVAFYAVTVAIQGVLGQGWPDLNQLGKFSGLPLVAVPVMLLLLLLTSYPEETGWRGFAAEEMLKTRSFLWTTVVIGLLWSLWHVPGMFVIQSYSQMGIATFAMFTLGIVSGSILLTWLYRASGGSIFIVALWHGCYNLVSGTAAAQGAPAAVVSTAVVVWAVIIVIAEVRRGRREHGAIPTLTARTT